MAEILISREDCLRIEKAIAEIRSAIDKYNPAK